MLCDLHGHDNELVMVYDHDRMKNSRKVLSIKSTGISGDAGLLPLILIVLVSSQV